MGIIVQKYGGTSVGSADKIRSVAARIKSVSDAGNKVAVVVSAMGDTTDDLIEKAESITKDPSPLAMDFLLATGEQQSVALLCMALNEISVPAEPFLGFQAGFLTDANHGKAKILSVDPKNVLLALNDGQVAVVAGFQGMADDGTITTIGRGGSDTSAVALAHAIGADSCEIYTDVEGVFTADPSICPEARLIKEISHEEMLELADAGARVLHDRAVEVAAKRRVPLVVKHSSIEGCGTKVIDEGKMNSIEGMLVSGITHSTGDAKVAVRRVPDQIGVTAKIFAPIAKAGIDVDLIIQNVSEDGFTDLTFTVPKDDLRRAMSITESAAKEVGAGKVFASGDIAKISIVGLGMRNHAGVAHRMFAALAKENIAIQMIGTSEIKVSVVIDMKHTEKAVRALHLEFNLGKDPS